MTDKQKIKILLKAAELIAEGKKEFACFAIFACDPSNGLVDEFVEFYGKFIGSVWFDNCENQNTRVLLLLTFAESLK